MIETTDSHYAGLDRRLGAYLVDVLLLYVLLAGLQVGLSLISGGFPFNILTTGLRIEGWVFLTISLPTWFYFAFSEQSVRQATIGKRLFKLRVTDVSEHPISFRRALVRTILKLVPWELTHLSILLPTPIYTDPNPGLRPTLLLVYGLLGLYMASMIFTIRKQSLYDLVVGTVVIHDRPSDAAPSPD